MSQGIIENIHGMVRKYESSVGNDEADRGVLIAFQIELKERVNLTSDSPAYKYVDGANNARTLHSAIAQLIAAGATLLASSAGCRPSEMISSFSNDITAQATSLTDTVTKYPALLDKLAQLQRYDIEEMSGNPFASYRCINEADDGDYLRREDVIRLMGGKPDDYI